MRALGLDPGLAATGWGIIDRIGGTYVLGLMGTIRTSARDDRVTRLAVIAETVRRLLRSHSVYRIAIEAVEYRPRQQRNEHVSADGLLATAEVVGVCVAVAGESRGEGAGGEHIPLLLRNADWRAALGIRRADDVRGRLALLLGHDVGGSEHSRDAVAIAMAALGR